MWAGSRIEAGLHVSELTCVIQGPNPKSSYGRQALKVVYIEKGRGPWQYGYRRLVVWDRDDRGLFESWTCRFFI